MNIEFYHIKKKIVKDTKLNVNSCFNKSEAFMGEFWSFSLLQIIKTRENIGITNSILNFY